MSKNYLPDIKVIKRPFYRIKRILAIILIVAIVCGTYILADYCSGALTLSAFSIGAKNSERINIEKHSLYAVVMGTYDKKDYAENVALGLQVQGAAGYVWQSANKYLVVGSIYSKYSDAEVVIKNIGETNYTPTIFEIKYVKLSLLIKGITKEDKDILVEAIDYFKTVYNEIYTYSINYDSSKTTNLAISSSINTLKSKSKVYVSKLQEMYARVDSASISTIRDSMIVLDTTLDSAVYRCLTDSGVNYYLKYLMCDVVDISYKMNISLHNIK